MAIRAVIFDIGGVLLLETPEEMLRIEVMLYSCEEGMQKPETDFYLLACERLGVH
ncbi:hypothetical protein KSD_82380 [Ktedonobacter sp. SOSP1-85]|uniref:hypothetical protein n=1 Tax=Ktedonobacter sp. SOSP1-85 TaxID=2778367 RepID=UPI001914F3F7|nr:hypothetical protein [Ktedonobacter sp. SOSP1-85]GHO80467.1 hypothetical protein KSD_82380 [Ktedonobacter sp. SOSP1-85]